MPGFRLLPRTEPILFPDRPALCSVSLHLGEIVWLMREDVDGWPRIRYLSGFGF